MRVRNLFRIWLGKGSQDTGMEKRCARVAVHCTTIRGWESQDTGMCDEAVNLRNVKRFRLDQEGQGKGIIHRDNEGNTAQRVQGAWCVRKEYLVTGKARQGTGMGERLCTLTSEHTAFRGDTREMSAHMHARSEAQKSTHAHTHTLQCKSEVKSCAESLASLDKAQPNFEKEKLTPEDTACA